MHIHGKSAFKNAVFRLYVHIFDIDGVIISNNFDNFAQHTHFINARNFYRSKKRKHLFALPVG